VGWSAAQEKISAHKAQPVGAVDGWSSGRDKDKPDTMSSGHASTTNNRDWYEREKTSHSDRKEGSGWNQKEEHAWGASK